MTFNRHGNFCMSERKILDIVKATTKHTFAFWRLVNVNQRESCMKTGVQQQWKAYILPADRLEDHSREVGTDC